jgi:hypothetical protein
MGCCWTQPVNDLRAGDRTGMPGDQIVGIDPDILAEVGAAFSSRLACRDWGGDVLDFRLSFDVNDQGKGRPGLSITAPARWVGENA